MLTTAQTKLLASAGVLVGQWGSALSPFEAELVADVCTRFVRDQGEAVITDHEWPVFEAAVEAMRQAQHAHLRGIAGMVADAFAD